MPTHYQVLGVAEDADTETIRRAYVALAKATHPDRRRTDDPTVQARAEERIRQANVAWNVLRDPVRRRDYDLSLPGPSAAPTTATGSTAPRPPAARPRPDGIVGASPASGIVVPAEHAGVWRFAPVVILLVVLLGILVVSAYASAGDDATAPAPRSSVDVVPEIDDCVLVVPVDGVRAPAPVGCGTAGALRVVAKVDTPRPCPPSTQQLPLSDQKTTLCLGIVP